MFTGLVQALGTLRTISEDELEITVMTMPVSFQDLALGDSIAVDGVCLTVARIHVSGFSASASPETLRRSTLGQHKGIVNLESSLRVGSKLGGHFVTGHVDGVGYLEVVEETAQAWEMTFTTPDPRVSRYIVLKGSIAVNGISLTVADCNPDGTRFRVAVIPLTYAETNLQYLQPGSPVNLEGDILGKYVEKFVRLGINGLDLNSEKSEEVESIASLTPAFLAEHGYL